MSTDISPQEAKILNAKELFDHRTPIAQKKFLAGRGDEISRLIGAIEDAGAHGIIFGDRGVGKTSIANCIQDSLVAAGVDVGQLACVRINCDAGDTYSSLWRKVFSQISVEHTHVTMGFMPEDVGETMQLADEIGEEITVNQVRHLLANCGKQCKLVVILDEFDRLESSIPIKRLLADTIKTLADFVVPATIVFVGVGESVSELLKEHESLGRHLAEVQVPRLGAEESANIFADRLPELGMTIEPIVQSTIIYLSRGLPYYIHQLGRYSIIKAIEADVDHITIEHMYSGFKESLDGSKQAMKSVYYEATLTNQTKSTHRQLLAACALAGTDHHGYFTASSLVGPMSKIVGHKCNVSGFNDKLADFCDRDRGQILQRQGKERTWRYRFRNPLMGTFVLLTSMDAKIITIDNISNPS
jgi:hypothetical protein